MITPAIVLQIAALALGMFVSLTISLAVVGLAPEISAEFKLPASAGSVLVAAYAVSTVFLAPFLAFSWLRIGYHQQAVMGLIVTAGGTVLCAVSEQFWIILVGRAISGAGGILFSTSAPAIAIALVLPSQRGRALAYVASGLSFASVLGVPGVTFWAIRVGWRLALVALACTAIFAAMAVWASLAPRPLASKLTGHPEENIFRHLFRDNLLSRLATTVMHLSARFMLIAPIAGILIDHYHINNEHLPTALLSFGSGGLIGTLVGGQLCDRIGGRSTIWFSIGALMASSGTLLAISVEAGEVAVLALSVIALSGAIFTPAQQNELLRDLEPENRRAILALNSVAIGLGMSIGATLGCAVSVAYGYPVLIISSIFLLSLAAVAHFVSRPRVKLA